MASIEQDDLFNIQDDEDMEEEEEQQPEEQEDYNMDDNVQQGNDDDDDEGMNDEDGEGDEDEDDEDEEEEDGEEGEDEEEDDEEDDEEEDEEEDEQVEEEDDEDDEEEEEGDGDGEDDDFEKFEDAKETQDEEAKEIEATSLPSELIDDNRSNEDDFLLGEVKSEVDSAPAPTSPEVPIASLEKIEAKLQEPEVKEKEPSSDKMEVDDNEIGSQAQADSNDQQEQEPEQEKEKAIPKSPTPVPAKSPSPQIDESSLTFRERVILKAKRATEFDIVPQTAIPYTSQCHSLAFTAGPKWILTGGEDGFIRKYDFIASIQGKAPLTTAQKHNLPDSLTNGGVICSYWENEQPLTRKQLMSSNPKLKESDFSTGSVSYEPKVNPVYSLDVERNGYWCLSGLLSGGISLYTMRYNEGAIHHYFSHGKKAEGNKSGSDGHVNAVSVLRLNQEQDKFLSGSWDKTIRYWDLNTGKTVVKFSGSSGQISNIQYRPQGLGGVVLTFQDDEEKNDDSEIDSLFEEEDDDDDNKDNEKKTSQEAQDKPVTHKPSFNTKIYTNDNIFMSSSIDGTINLWDVRTPEPALRLGVSENTPPWCMTSTWSNDGEYIYVGRRNSTVEEFSIRMPHKRATHGAGTYHHSHTHIPNVSKLLQFPTISGPVSAISTMPNSNFLLCGSNDNIRLYNLSLYDSLANTSINVKKQATPFLIIPGHNGGTLSQLYVDQTGRFMVSASGNRGWGHGTYTDAVLVYEIDFEGI